MGPGHEPETEWAFEGGPEIAVGADGDRTRYQGGAYDGMRGMRGLKGQFEWYRGITASSRNAWGVLFYPNQTRPDETRKDGSPMKNTMMKLVSLLTCAMMLLSLAACASAQEQVKIAVCQFAAHGSLDNCREGFLLGLAEEGFREGENLTVDYQNAQADMAVANQIAQNAATQGADLICAIATPMAQAAYNFGDMNQIPVVYTAVTDPVAAMLAGEDGSAPGQVTGTSDKLPVENQLKMIRSFMPEAGKIGILYTTSETNSESALKEYQELAPQYGFEIVPQGVAVGADIPLALDSLLPKVDCLTNLTDNTVVTNLAVVLDKATAAGKPVYGSEIEQVKNGCVAAEGLDYISLGKQTGKMAARILKGEAAGDIPFETIVESALYINPQALEALGISIPQADQERAVDVTKEE